MISNQESATVLIVENLIKAANKALKADKLNQAATSLQEAFKESEEAFAMQAGEIRTMLNDFSDRMVKHEPPNWPEARQALSLLEELKLQDDQVRLWQRHLALKQAKTLLNQKRVADAFEIFETLIADHGATTGQAILKAEISPIIYDSITNLADVQQWALLSQTIERLELLWKSDDELSRLLKTFSIAVAQARENYDAKIAAFQTEHEAKIVALQTEKAALHTEHESRLATFQTEYEAKIVALQTEKAALQTDHESWLTTLQTEHEAKIAAFQTEYEAKIATIQTEHESWLATLQTEHEAKIAALHTELRRRQGWIYALAIILGLTIVAYAVVILLPI